MTKGVTRAFVLSSGPGNMLICGAILSSSLAPRGHFWRSHWQELRLFPAFFISDNFLTYIFYRGLWKLCSSFLASRVPNLLE